MYSIVIFLPTRNRPDSVKEYLEKCISFCMKYNICIYISDSSNNEDTKSIVSEVLLSDANYTNYIRYYKNDNYSGKTSDLKVIEGLISVKSLAKYVWVSGDGIIPCIEETHDLITKCFDAKYDVIQFNMEKDKDKYHIEIMDSPIDYFKRYGWIATSYGATIISTTLIDQRMLLETNSLLSNTGFVYWNYLFKTLSTYTNPKICVLHSYYFQKNSNKKTNSSYSSGKFFTFWVENWLRAINCLPQVYNMYKDGVAKDIGLYLKLYSHGNLLMLRGTGNLDCEKYNKYKSQFPMVTDVSLNRIYFYATFPRIIATIYSKTRTRVASIIRSFRK